MNDETLFESLKSAAPSCAYCGEAPQYGVGHPSEDSWDHVLSCCSGSYRGTNLQKVFADWAAAQAKTRAFVAEHGPSARPWDLKKGNEMPSSNTLLPCCKICKRPAWVSYGGGELTTCESIGERSAAERDGCPIGRDEVWMTREQWVELMGTPKAAGASDIWRNAVEDACVVSYVDFDENDPKGTLHRLLVWESQVALDPAVSKQAADLHAKIASLHAELEQLVHLKRKP